MISWIYFNLPVAVLEVLSRLPIHYKQEFVQMGNKMLDWCLDSSVNHVVDPITGSMSLVVHALVTLPPEWLSFFLVGLIKVFWQWFRRVSWTYSLCIPVKNLLAPSSVWAPVWGMTVSRHRQNGQASLLLLLPIHTSQCLLASRWTKPFGTDFHHLLVVLHYTPIQMK